MTVYLDTSVVLAKLLGEPGALKEWGHWTLACTSELTRVEAFRALDRLRLEGKLDDTEVADLRKLVAELIDELDLIAVTPPILEAASASFPTVVGTLDAIHLASANAYIGVEDRALTLLTHDRRLGTAAKALGIATRGWS